MHTAKQQSSYQIAARSINVQNAQHRTTGVLFWKLVGVGFQPRENSPKSDLSLRVTEGGRGFGVEGGGDVAEEDRPSF